MSITWMSYSCHYVLLQTLVMFQFFLLCGPLWPVLGSISGYYRSAPMGPHRWVALGQALVIIW